MNPLSSPRSKRRCSFSAEVLYYLGNLCEFESSLGQPLYFIHLRGPEIYGRLQFRLAYTEPENNIFVSKQSKKMNFSHNLTEKAISFLKQIEKMIFSSMQAQNLISSSKQPENEPQSTLKYDIFSSNR